MSQDSIRASLGLRLGEVARCWRGVLDTRLRPVGLTQAKWLVLVQLHRLGDGLSQTALSAELRIEGPTLVRLLDLLEHDGFVHRQAQADDRRTKAIRLTELGKRKIAEVEPIASELREELLAGVSQADLRACIRVFDRIKGNAATLRGGRDAI